MKMNDDSNVKEDSDGDGDRNENNNEPSAEQETRKCWACHDNFRKSFFSSKQWRGAVSKTNRRCNSCVKSDLKVDSDTAKKKKEKQNSSAAHATAPSPDSNDVVERIDYYEKGLECQKQIRPHTARKIFAMGIMKQGDERCMSAYLNDLISEGFDNPRDLAEFRYFLNNRKKDAVARILFLVLKKFTNVHKCYPFTLECLICGTGGRWMPLYCGLFLALAVFKEVDKTKYFNDMTMMENYWWQMYMDDEPKVGTLKDSNKNTRCTSCLNDLPSLSENPTLECACECGMCFYCCRGCQKTHWDSGHGAWCRQYRILEQYHKPHAEEIKQKILDGVPAGDIEELQRLRDMLGLTRSSEEDKEYYEKLQNRIETGKSKKHPIELIVPRSDGTVRIGSSVQLLDLL